MSFGSPLDKRKVLPLVQPSKWNEMLELNRMAFDSFLPKNSESRCISIAIKLIKKNTPHIKWILSFADGTQCGDGAIYRASGFVLTAIRVNENTCQIPSGHVIHKMTLESNPTSPRAELNGRSYYDVTGGKYDFYGYCAHLSGTIVPGFQLRYIYLIDKSCRITVPILPFSKIEEMGAGMYRGKKITRADGLNKSRSATSGEMTVTPISALQFTENSPNHA